MKYSRSVSFYDQILVHSNIGLTWQLLTIMSNTIAYLTSRSNFVQVSPDVPITKQRNPEKFDAPDVLEGILANLSEWSHGLNVAGCAANQKELVTDLIVKAKQVEYLIQSLPEPEPEEDQVRLHRLPSVTYNMGNQQHLNRPSGCKPSKTRWSSRMKNISGLSLARVRFNTSFTVSSANRLCLIQLLQRIFIVKWRTYCVQCSTNPTLKWTQTSPDDQLICVVKIKFPNQATSVR